MTRGAEPFNFDGLHTAYPALRDHIVANGAHVSPRGSGTTEVLGMSFSVRDAVNRGVPVGVGRKLGVKMQVIDGITLLAGQSYHDVNTRLVGIMDEFGDEFPADDDQSVPAEDLALLKSRYPYAKAGDRFQQGAYGPRIAEQMRKIEQQLRADRYTRQAVAILWSETDRGPWKDRPCATQYQFMYRDGHLDMFVTFRSNDLRRGVAYDVGAAGQVQAALAHVLGWEPGTMHWYAASMHIYDEDLQWMIDNIKHWKNTTDMAVDNPREDWGPEWSALEPGTYSSWGELQDRYTQMLDAARYGEDFAPVGAVEEWYWEKLDKLDRDTAMDRPSVI